VVYCISLRKTSWVRVGEFPSHQIKFSCFSSIFLELLSMSMKISFTNLDVGNLDSKE
jgi:hypothetical protein